MICGRKRAISPKGFIPKDKVSRHFLGSVEMKHYLCEGISSYKIMVGII